MNDRPLILITNDDGVEAKGIKELTECLRDLGDIVVFAPDGPRSGMASAITSLVPIKYTLVRKEKGLTVYSCTGTPVDCVKLAINEVLERKPDLLGLRDQSWWQPCHLHPVFRYDGGSCRRMRVRYSFDGSVALGSSCGCRLCRELPFRAHACTADHKRRIAAWHLSEPERSQCPERKRDEGMPAGGRRWTNEFKRSENAAGEPVFWLAGAFENAKPIHADNDTLALDSGYASLVPCKIDVTDYDFLAVLKNS